MERECKWTLTRVAGKIRLKEQNNGKKFISDSWEALMINAVAVFPLNCIFPAMQMQKFYKFGAFLQPGSYVKGPKNVIIVVSFWNYPIF